MFIVGTSVVVFFLASESEKIVILIRLSPSRNLEYEYDKLLVNYVFIHSLHTFYHIVRDWFILIELNFFWAVRFQRKIFYIMK